MLSRLLGLVRSADELDSAIQVYDAVRRPRAQHVVQESARVAMAYYFLDPKFGADLEKITEEANKRLPLIWYHDLDADLQRATMDFYASVRASTGKSAVSVAVVETKPGRPEGTELSRDSRL